MPDIEVALKEVTYKQFASALEKKYHQFRKDNEKSEVDVAYCLGKTTITLRNCFAPIKQVVSDKIITSLMKCVAMEGKIEWQHGKRKFFIEK